EERLVHIAGPDRRYLVRSFKGADLEGATDVVPVAESSFPWSKTARQSMLMELASRLPHLFVDPETGQFDRARFARLLPLGGLEALSANEDLDLQEAQREEEIFEAYGIESLEVPQVEFWQDHEAHYRQHCKVLKSARYWTWPEEARRLFEDHVRQHDEMRARAQLTGTSSPAGQEMALAMQAGQQAAAAGEAGVPQAGSTDPLAEILAQAGGRPEPPARRPAMPARPGLSPYGPAEEFVPRDLAVRSEERRVGKEGRCRGAAAHRDRKEGSETER